MVLLAGGNAVDPLLFRYRARDLRAEDLAPMQAAIASHYARGRGFIARTLCALWEAFANHHRRP